MSRLLALLPQKAESNYVWTNPAAWLPFGEFPDRRTIAGERVNPDTALTLPTWWALLSGIAADVAKVPACAVRSLSPRGREPLHDHVVTRLFHDEFDNETSAFTGKETLTQWALGWGNGCAEIERDEVERPIALHLIHPSRVRSGRNRETGRFEFQVRGDDIEKKFGWFPMPAEDVFHLHGFGDGTWGYSALRSCANAIGLTLAAQSFGAAIFGNGLSPGLSVIPKNALGPNEYKSFIEELKRVYQGAQKAGGIFATNHPADITRLSFPPEEAQYLELRYFQVEDIARIVRRSPQKIGHTKQAQGWSTLEALQIDDVTDCLMPWWVRFEAEARRKLLRAERNVSLRFYVNGLMRGDSKTRAEYYRARIMAGTMTPNEVRELEDENPSDEPNADRLQVQGATILLSSLTDEPTEPETPPPAPMSPAPMDPEEEPDEEPEDGMEPETPKPDASMLRPFFDAAAARVVRKECLALERALKKHAAGGDGFREWADGFYAEQRTYARAEFGPCASALKADERLSTTTAALWPDALARTGEAVKTKEGDLAAALSAQMFAALTAATVAA